MLSARKRLARLALARTEAARMIAVNITSTPTQSPDPSHLEALPPSKYTRSKTLSRHVNREMQRSLKWLVVLHETALSSRELQEAALETHSASDLRKPHIARKLVPMRTNFETTSSVCVYNCSQDEPAQPGTMLEVRCRQTMHMMSHELNWCCQR